MLALILLGSTVGFNFPLNALCVFYAMNLFLL